VINFVQKNSLKNNLHTHSNGGKVESLSALPFPLRLNVPYFLKCGYSSLKKSCSFLVVQHFKSYSLCSIYSLIVARKVLNKMPKTENKHTLNYFFNLLKNKKLPLVSLFSNTNCLLSLQSIERSRNKKNA
jgi:hypothetical protein